MNYEELIERLNDLLEDNNDIISDEEREEIISLLESEWL